MALQLHVKGAELARVHDRDRLTGQSCAAIGHKVMRVIEVDRVDDSSRPDRIWATGPISRTASGAYISDRIGRVRMSRVLVHASGHAVVDMRRNIGDQNGDGLPAY